MKAQLSILSLALLTLTILFLLSQHAEYPVLALVSPLPPTATDPPSFCYYLRHGVLVPCKPTSTPAPTATPGPFVSPLVQPKDTGIPAAREQPKHQNPTPAPPALPWSW